jgi:hypothetical protein
LIYKAFFNAVDLTGTFVIGARFLLL